MSRIRIAVVGCGVMGRTHARFAAESPDCELVCAVDTDRARAEEVAAAHGTAAGTDFVAALADGVEAVVLAVPHRLHRDLACRALAAGKHVLVEKPISLNVPAAEEIVAAADSSRRVLLVGHVLRHYPANQWIKAMIDSGRLGRLFQVRYHAEHDADLSRRQWIASPDEGGVILGAAIHHTDVVSWWAGGVLAVRAYGRTVTPLFRTTGMHDHCLIVYELPGGALGESCYSLGTHSRQMGYDQAMLSFEQGTVRLDGLTGEITLRTEIDLPDFPAGTHRIASENDWSAGLRRQLAAFVEAIRGRPSAMTPAEAVHAVRVALAARRSAEAEMPGERVEID